MHLRLRKCEKSLQTYRKLADLWLRNTSCSFAEFAVAELSVNLRAQLWYPQANYLVINLNYNFQIANSKQYT